MKQIITLWSLVSLFLIYGCHQKLRTAPQQAQKQVSSPDTIKFPVMSTIRKPDRDTIIKTSFVQKVEPLPRHVDADAGFQQAANDQLEKINTTFSTGTTRLYSDGSKYPEFYGGSYIADKGKLAVYIIGDIAIGNKKLAKIVGSTDFITLPGKYSYKTLTKIMDDLNTFKLNKDNHAIADNFNFYGLMENKNRVEVELDEFNEEKIMEFKMKVMDSPAIIFKKSSGKIMLE